MRSPAVVLLALTSGVFTADPAMAQFRGGMRTEQVAAKNGWLTSLNAGKEAARKSGKPLMVVLRCVP